MFNVFFEPPFLSKNALREKVLATNLLAEFTPAARPASATTSAGMSLGSAVDHLPGLDRSVSYRAGPLFCDKGWPGLTVHLTQDGDSDERRQKP